MATIDLSGVLKGIGEDILESVEKVRQSADLPDDLKAKAPIWAAGAVRALADAGLALKAKDTPAYDDAIRRLHNYRTAAEAVMVGEGMTVLAAARVEASKRLAGALDLGISIGLKLLAAAIV